MFGRAALQRAIGGLAGLVAVFPIDCRQLQASCTQPITTEHVFFFLLRHAMGDFSPMAWFFMATGAPELFA
jgi:hypothetical protein